MMRSLLTTGCAVYALSPENRGPALKRMIHEFAQLCRRKLAVIMQIKETVRTHTPIDDAVRESPAPSTQSFQPEWCRLPQRPPNQFSSRRNTGSLEEVSSYEDAWELWNADGGSKFRQNEENTVLQYWKSYVNPDHGRYHQACLIRLLR